MRGGNSGCQIETVTSRVFCRTGQARRIGEAQALDAREAQGPRPNLAVGSRMMILEMALDVPRTPVAAGSVMPGGNGDAPGTFGLAFSASGRLTGSGDSLPNRVAGSPGRRVAGSPGRPAFAGVGHATGTVRPLRLTLAQSAGPRPASDRRCMQRRFACLSRQDACIRPQFLEIRAAGTAVDRLGHDPSSAP